MANETTYFAAEPSEGIVAKLLETERVYFDFCKAASITAKIRKSIGMLHGYNERNGSLSWTVVQDDDDTLHVSNNRYAAIGRNIANLVLQSRPAIQCEAANTDRQSLEQTMLGQGLVDFHLTEKGLEDLMKRAVRRAVFLGEGFIEGTWDVHGGEDVAPEPEQLDALLGAVDGAPPPQVQMVKSGEPRFWCLGPMDVIRDPHCPSWAELTWRTTLRWVSRWDLAAKYPDKAHQLSGARSRADWDSDRRIDYGRGANATDLVGLRTFYHDKTPALPDGRMVHYVDDVLLFDGPLPFQAHPLKRVVADEMDGTPFGHTPMFDLLAAQEAIDAVNSKVLTSQLGRSNQVLLTGDGTDLSVSEVTQSFIVAKVKDVGQVRELTWADTSAEYLNFRKDLISEMETVAGTNSVAMGEPSQAVGSDSSGAKLALIEATAMRNATSLEQSVTGLYRDVALLVIHLYRDFGGSHERRARIAGKSRGYLERSFTSEDLSGIDRVKVEVANPMLRTVSGKMSIADKAVELGVIGPGQLDKYIHLLKEGTAEPLLEAKQAQLLRIRGENESLMSGEGSHNALISDPHWQEIPEHLSLLDNPGLREPTPENEQIQATILGAVQQHIDLLMQMPPWMVLMRGGPEALAIWQQIQMSMAPAPMPGEEPPPVEGEAPPPPEGMQAEAMPSMPSMPKKPNGERAEVLAPDSMMGMEGMA